MAGFKSGSLKRIYVKNFMTYHECQVNPGPNLNVVIGPNGTGKSTLMCAICLGLGGEPSAIGRAAKITEFIRSEQSEAVIEITLRNESGPDVIVKHVIHRNGKSDWFANGVRYSKEKVLEIFKVWNINMNNLCQFQSQEKVQDFSKMSPQELLKNTQVCTGDHSLEADLNVLIQKQKDLKSLQQQMTQNKTSLEKLQEDAKRLDKEVESFKTYQDTEKRINLYKKKIELFRYQEVKEKADAAKEELKTKRTALTRAESELNPRRDLISTAKQKMETLQREVLTEETKLTQKANVVSNKRKEVLDLKEKIDDFKSDYESKVKENEKIAKEIHDLELLVQRDQNMVEAAKQTRVDVEPELSELKEKIELNDLRKNEISKLRSDTSTQINENEREKSSLVTELGQINSVTARRLDMLRRFNPQVFEAYGILQEMRRNGQFQHPVYEPMAVTLSVNNTANAKFVEKSISHNDLNAFGFESKEDMNRFISQTREKKNLKLGAYHCPPGMDIKDDPNFQHPVDISQIQRFGFTCYLSDLIELNNSQLRYVCKMSKLHRVPIGTDEVSRNVAAFRKQFGNVISTFYAGTIGYNIRKSRFSGEYLTSSWEVTEGRILTTGVDLRRQTEIQRKIKHHEERIQALSAKLVDFEKLIKELDRDQEKRRDRQKALIVQKNHIPQMEAHLRNKQRQLDAKKRSTNNLEELKAQLDSQCRGIFQQIAVKQSDLVGKVGEFQLAMRLQGIRQVLKTQALQQHDKLVEGLKSSEAALSEIRDEFRRAEREYNARKCDAQRHSQKLIDQKIYDQNGKVNAELRTSLQSLADVNDLESLEQEMANDEARLSCLTINKTNGNIVNDLKEKKRQIELLIEFEATSADRVARLEKEVIKIHERWIEKTENLVGQISTNFGRLLADMGCAGEVVLDRGSHEHDYHQYGIRIRVKYRDTEQLRDLTFQSQSGGERSVATAIYMMSIQELTTVPFRCVDEINQGMDSTNERKIFDLLVRTSCEENSAQYFLLTPKLLTGLNYSRRMKVHDVHNGRRNVTHKQWSLKRFVQSGRKAISP